mgnify:FL=1
MTNSPAPFPEISDIVRGNRSRIDQGVREFCKELGVSAQTVSVLEHGSTPTLDTLARWANSDKPWLRQMALDIATVQVRQLMSIFMRN